MIGLTIGFTFGLVIGIFSGAIMLINALDSSVSYTPNVRRGKS